MCDHRNVTIYSRLVVAATRYEPAEYDEWAVCNDCGERLDISDIPEGADEREGELDMPGTPHEYYD